MLNERQVERLLYQAVEDCFKIGRAWTMMGKTDSNLKFTYSWNEVETLCKVLEIDDLQYWNSICSKYPVMGAVTEP